MDYNDVLNTLTSVWPLVVTVAVAVLLGSVWLAEGGSGRLSRRIPGTKTHAEYRFFREHGYWPGTPEAWQEEYELGSDDEK